MTIAQEIRAQEIAVALNDLPELEHEITKPLMRMQIGVGVYDECGDGVSKAYVLIDKQTSRILLGVIRRYLADERRALGYGL